MRWRPHALAPQAIAHSPPLRFTYKTFPLLHITQFSTSANLSTTFVLWALSSSSREWLP